MANISTEEIQNRAIQDVKSQIDALSERIEANTKELNKKQGELANVQSDK